MIDFHCHLDLYEKPASVVEECVARKIYVLAVTTTPKAWDGTRLLVGNADRVRVALGLHPQLASDRRSELPLFDQLLPDAHYVGEIGLDGSPELRHGWDDQLVVFRHILGSCRSAGGRIMSIHSRRAAGAVLDQIESCPGAGIPVLHWYSGGVRDLERAIELGCWFSVGPAMALSKSGLDLIRRMPRNRLLTETDGPFTSVRDAHAFPWHAELVQDALAELWNEPTSSVRGTLHSNLRVLIEKGGASDV